jgi:hypothetical protein
MRDRLPIVLSVSALLVAVFGATPVGHAAGRAIHAAPPFAKTAAYAKVAGDSAKLNGRKSTLAGAPGTIPVVGKDGKLPASIGAVGPQGPTGPKGDKGTSGAKGAPGLAGVHIVRDAHTYNTPNGIVDWSTFCPVGEIVTGGGGLVQQYNSSGFVGILPIVGIQFQDRSVLIQGPPVASAGTVVVNAFAICAKTAA